MEKIIEFADCFVQLGVLAFIVVWSARQTKEIWLFRLMMYAFACFFFGTLFWTLHIFVTGGWPQGFSASYLSFLGFYCFFIAVEAGLKEKWTDEQRAAAQRHRKTALLGPAVVVVFHASYILLGGRPVLRTIFCVFLSLLFYHVLLGFFAGGAYRRYHVVALVAFILELMVYFFGSSGWDPGYYVVSFTQMAVWFFLIAAAIEGANA